jgi:hypothetical protein
MYMCFFFNLFILKISQKAEAYTRAQISSNTTTKVPPAILMLGRQINTGIPRSNDVDIRKAHETARVNDDKAKARMKLEYDTRVVHTHRQQGFSPMPQGDTQTGGLSPTTTNSTYENEVTINQGYNKKIQNEKKNQISHEIFYTNCLNDIIRMS